MLCRLSTIAEQLLADLSDRTRQYSCAFPGLDLLSPGFCTTIAVGLLLTIKLYFFYSHISMGVAGYNPAGIYLRSSDLWTLTFQKILVIILRSRPRTLSSIGSSCSKTLAMYWSDWAWPNIYRCSPGRGLILGIRSWTLQNPTCEHHLGLWLCLQTDSGPGKSSG